MPSATDQLSCLEWDFWYDYFGCPQTSGTSPSKNTPDIQAVVNSIPAYCDIADFTLVLAPAIKHSDTHQTISQRTWSNRGWCRLERLATKLSGNDKSLVVVSAPTRLLVTAGPDWIKAWPDEGHFTLDADRHVVREVTGQLIDMKCQSLWEQGDKEKWCFYSALVPKARGFQGCQFGESLPEFLNRYELDTPSCFCLGTALTPLILASIEGNLDVMTQLLEKQADVNQVIPWNMPDAHIDGRHSALSMASMLSTPEAVKKLLNWGASVDLVKNMNNSSVLSIAGYFGNAPAMKVLLAHDAPIVCDDEGSNPLHVGAFSPNPWVTQILLDHGVNPDAFCYVGATALAMTSICNADPSHAERMLKAKADPNLAGSSEGCLHSMLSWGSKKKVAMGSASELEWNLAVANNGTPLHLAAINGSLEIAKLLLAYGANPDATWGDDQLTAKDLAQMRAHQDIVELFDRSPRKGSRPPAMSLSSLDLDIGFMRGGTPSISTVASLSKGGSSSFNSPPPSPVLQTRC